MNAESVVANPKYKMQSFQTVRSLKSHLVKHNCNEYLLPPYLAAWTKGTVINKQHYDSFTAVSLTFSAEVNQTERQSNQGKDQVKHPNYTVSIFVLNTVITDLSKTY